LQPTWRRRHGRRFFLFQGRANGRIDRAALGEYRRRQSDNHVVGASNDEHRGENDAVGSIFAD
jgi:hypothetical protein